MQDLQTGVLRHLLGLLEKILEVDDVHAEDDMLLAPYELRGGWLRLGRSEVAGRAFVGNSEIVGPRRTVPDEGLIGVLSQAPADAPYGSSWLGQPPMALPRQERTGDLGRTFDPPRGLVVARGAIELCRVLPLMISLTLGDLVVAALDEAQAKLGLLGAAAISGLVLFATGIVACLTASLIKWLLVRLDRAQRVPAVERLGVAERAGRRGDRGTGRALAGRSGARHPSDQRLAAHARGPDRPWRLDRDVVAARARSDRHR